jgi:hypothetical protein
MAFILETTQNAMNPRQPRERSTPANVASIVRCASHAHLTSKAPRRQRDSGSVSSGHLKAIVDPDNGHDIRREGPTVTTVIVGS